MTIYALSSGPGLSGIAVIRISGPDTKKVLQNMTFLKLPEAKVATLRKFKNPETKDLIDEGAEIWIHDPKVSELQIGKDLKMEPSEDTEEIKDHKLLNKTGKWKFSNNLKIFDRAHAVLLLTEWEEYKNINWEDISKKMVNPAWVFDARSIIDPSKVENANLNLWRVGDGTSK